MSNQFNNNKKCSKCNIEYDQDLGSSYSFEVGKQRRIFTKNGKHFCFNCLASEYNVNCRLCHKRINSKDELAYWGGVISINGSYELDPNPDFFDFRCLDCGNKKFDTNRPIEDQINPKKCRIAGCSQKSYYSYPHLCKSHSKPCQGATSYGRKCNLAIGIDEGGFCKHCKNQTETWQQRKSRLETEGNKIGERYEQAIQQAQSWWDSLSSEERQKEIRSLESRLPARIEKFWNSRGHKNADNQTEGNADYPHWDTFENGKLHQSDPTRAPWAIVDEFYEKLGSSKLEGKTSGDNNNSPLVNNSNSPAQLPQSENNQNQPDTNHDNSRNNLENRDNNGVKKIEIVNSEVENKPNKNDNENLVINLKEVKKITLRENGDLEIEFNNTENSNYSISQVITSGQINNSQELQRVKNYCQQNGKNSLSQSELNKILATSAAAAEKPKEGNNVLLIGGISGVILLVGVFIWLLLKKRKVKKS